ncbi:RNA-directed RNA polymerase L [Bienertia sinuspersici]
MDAIHVRIDGDVNSVKKNKKRKKDETSDYGGEELVDEGTIKKMKTKVSSDMSEGFSDVVISTV